MTPTPTQEQIEAAKNIYAELSGDYIKSKEDKLVSFLAARDARRDAEIVGPWREAVEKAERFVANVYNFTPTTNGLDMRDTLKFGLELRALLSSPPHPSPAPNKGESR